MAIIIIKIDHKSERGKNFINQLHSMSRFREVVKILYETYVDNEHLLNDYIKNSEEITSNEKMKEFLESVYEGNIKSKNEVILKIR
jgi:hypothetical protein